MRRSRRGALVAALLIGGGCAPLGRAVPEPRLRSGNAYRWVEGLEVPAVPGVAGCGAQALAAALTRGDGPDAATALAAALPWHDVGATPVELLVEARRRGAEARIARGTWEALEDAIESGATPLIMFDAGHAVPTLLGDAPLPAVMHWAAVSGVAKDGSRALLGAPARRHHVVERGWLLPRWDRSDRCLIVVSARGGEIGNSN